MKELNLPAAVHNITQVTQFVNEELKLKFFLSKGDPLAKADPDVSLSAEEREIGGLGIYMVKKSMDSVIYEYRDGKSILKIRKHM